MVLAPAIIALATEVLRLVNNLIEAKPPEIREAEARAWFGMWWPLLKRFVPSDVREQIENLVKPKT